MKLLGEIPKEQKMCSKMVVVQEGNKGEENDGKRHKINNC
jgi:hypothetical protein